jgi:bacteriocin-like protein
MSSQKPDQQPKTPPIVSKEELSTDDLEKVTGGLKKNVGVTGPRSGLSADPCEGGE